MQRFNDIQSFIDALQTLADSIGSDTAIESSTSVTCSDVIQDMSFNEWEDISGIIDESKMQDGAHAQDMFIHDNLMDMGYSEDEIIKITDFIGSDL